MDGHSNLPQVVSGNSQGNPVLGYKLIDTSDPSLGPQIQELWDKLSKEDYAFDDNSRGDHKRWLMNLWMPATLHYIVGEMQGYAVVQNLEPNVGCIVHHAIFDKGLKGAPLVHGAREFLGHLFDEYDLRRIGTVVPTNNSYGKRFATLLGFKFEGEIRKAFLFKGEYLNLMLYGMLKEEYLKKEGVH
jgi:RimJ/RimL family protein N-acetyltransferase